MRLRRTAGAAAAATFLAVSLCGRPCAGQGFRNPPDGPAALSQAGAFVAQCDDPSAVTNNPAGLTQLTGDSFMIGSTFAFPVTEYSSGAVRQDRDATPGVLPYFYYASDLGTQNVRFGLGVTSPYGQATEWDRDLTRAWIYSAAYYSGMQTVNVTPVLAYRFTPSFSAAVGANAYYSRIVVNQLGFIPLPPMEVTQKLRVDGTALAPSAGLLYRAPRWRLGMTWKGGFDCSYDGDFDIPGLVEGDADAELSFPHIVAAGLAVYPRENLKIEADAEWVGYSAVKTVPINAAGTQLVQPRYWNDCWSFSLGAEYRPSPAVALRAGVSYIETPVPDATFEPGIPDADRVMISTGVSFAAAGGSIDFAFVTVIFDDRTIQLGIPYDGTYESRARFVSCSYRRSF